MKKRSLSEKFVHWSQNGTLTSWLSLFVRHIAMVQPDWGPLATQLSAIAACLALGLSIFSLYRNYRLEKKVARSLPRSKILEAFGAYHATVLQLSRLKQQGWNDIERVQSQMARAFENANAVYGTHKGALTEMERKSTDIFVELLEATNTDWQKGLPTARAIFFPSVILGEKQLQLAESLNDCRQALE